MKTIIKHILLAVAVLFGILSASASNSVSYSCSFTSSDYTVKDSVFNGKTYSVVSYQDNPVIADQTGAPLLPYRVILVSVPYNSSNFRVRINNAEYNSTELQHCVVPVQTPVSMNAVEMPPFVEPDPSYYNSGIFPRTEAEVLDETLLGGFNKVARVVINQCRYNHAESRLSKLEKIDLTLEWDDCANPANLHPIVPALSGRVAENIEYTKEFVVNPEDVETNGTFAKNRMRKAAQQSDSVETFEYLIVTTHEFAESLKPLEYMRKLRGFTTRIACIEDILADPKYAMGDTISNINDDAGKLRAYLTDVYTNNGTKYVLLAGKYPKIPVREISKDSEIYGSDDYYNDINSIWVSSGPLRDNNTSSYDRELRIGRLNFSNNKEIDNYLWKLYYYEVNPGNGYPAYINDSYVYVSYDMNMCYEEASYDIENDYRKVFVNIDEQFQESYNSPTGKMVMDKLKSQNFGFVDFVCHGNPEGVRLTDKINGDYRPYGINALDSETVNHVVESGSGLDCWNNKYYPNWSFSSSCSIMPLKDSYFRDGVTPLTYNFGDSYTIGGKYGGVAMIGSSNDIMKHMAFMSKKYFFENALTNIRSNSSSIIGNMLSRAKGLLYTLELNRGNNINLFGDPTINLWFRSPSVLVPDNSNIGYNLTKANSLDEAIVVTNSIDGKATPEFFSTNLFMLKYYDYDFDKIHTITGAHIPTSVMPVRLHSYKFDSETYILCDRMYVGVESNSDVKFRDGATTTICAMGNIVVDNNTCFEKGSETELTCYGTVDLNKMIIEDGAKLTIKAKGVKFGSEAQIAKGAEFKFINL